MKSKIHPQINPVVFVDSASDTEFITTSTLRSEKTRDIDGIKHFVITVEISSASHPFYTGKQRFIDTGGRLEKFKARMDKVEKKSVNRRGKKVKHAARAAKQIEETEA